jgi:hypothetical protein
MFDLILENLPLNIQTFSDLDKIHKVANRLFLAHQIACMSANWEEALNAMELMYELRMQNIQDTEDLLIPLYQSFINEIPQGGAIKFFVRENKLVRKNLDSFVHNISNVVLYDTGNEVNLVKLFESYHSFKDLLDHHDARKRVFLFKLLDEKVDSRNRESVLGKINYNYTALINKIGLPV